MINCEKVLILGVIFERKMDASNGEKEIPVGVEINYAPNKDKSEKNAKLEMILTVGDREQEDIPLFFSIKLAGIFDWETLTNENAEEEINSDGAEYLMSFARTYLYDMMYKSGIEGIVLPLKWKD